MAKATQAGPKSKSNDSGSVVPAVQKSAVKREVNIEPKIRFRDQAEIIHHLFKGEIANAVKADKFGPIKVKNIEHVHHFHTHNSNGSPQRHCHAVCGHVHEWTWRPNPETGELEAECGPPLKKVVRPGPNGVTKVTYEEILIVNPEGGPKIRDNHRHKMTYLGSDKLTKAKVEAIQQSNAKRIGEVTQGAVTAFADPAAPEGYSVVDSDRSGTQE